MTPRYKGFGVIEVVKQANLQISGRHLPCLQPYLQRAAPHVQQWFAEAATGKIAFGYPGLQLR